MSTSRRSLAAALLLSALLFAAGPAGARGAPRLDEEALGCEACILVEDGGRALFARAPARPLPNASTTKIVTAVVVAARTDPGATVRVSPGAAATPGGGFSLAAGDTASVEDLLHALLLASSNDAAVALAEHVAGTEDAFVEEMNALSERLGARRTHFVTAHGLDAAGHHSTARDLAILGAALLEDPLLAAIVAREEEEILVRGRRVVLENRNLLVEDYRGAIGIKTGYTAGAGNVLVAAARRAGRTLIAVSMRSPDAAADARALLDYGFAVLARVVLLVDSRPVAALVFPAGATPVYPTRRVRGALPDGGLVTRFDARARAPVSRGEVVGRVVLEDGSAVVARVDGRARAPVEREALPWPVALLAALLRGVAALVGAGA